MFEWILSDVKFLRFRTASTAVSKSLTQSAISGTEVGIRNALSIDHPLSVNKNATREPTIHNASGGRRQWRA
ncbi:hypothetical protein RE6C_00952 [Rhodopirellula europaea 6C]|uniref:Uncharacterized protein n=1 Tax=Rhodopirellula europaea 6C TaxID=1263867 RepID=M2AMC1_9BACT|nr:hypothetical protein RE6C_00952 [Rhodopirellula europaea 6C]